MATKNQPGTYDCYANAAPDEPMFVLLGRDRAAPIAVMVWAAARAALRDRGAGDISDAQLAEAQACVAAMDAWARGLGKDPADARQVFYDWIVGYADLIRAAPVGPVDALSDADATGLLEGLAALDGGEGVPAAQVLRDRVAVPPTGGE